MTITDPDRLAEHEVLAAILNAEDPQAMAMHLAGLLRPEMFAGLKEALAFSSLAALASHGIVPDIASVLALEDTFGAWAPARKLTRAELERFAKWRRRPNGDEAAVRVFLSAVWHCNPGLRTKSKAPSIERAALKTLQAEARHLLSFRADSQTWHPWISLAHYNRRIADEGGQE